MIRDYCDWEDDEMAEFEKVVVGIEHCDKLGCSMCPYKPCGYSPMNCRIHLMRDALELLKERHEDVKPFHKCIGNEYTLIEDSGFDYCPYCGKKVFWE